jgi:hypothetical protein
MLSRCGVGRRRSYAPFRVTLPTYIGREWENRKKNLTLKRAIFIEAGAVLLITYSKTCLCWTAVVPLQPRLLKRVPNLWKIDLKFFIFMSVVTRN